MKEAVVIYARVMVSLGISEFPDFCEIKSKLFNDMDIRNHNMNFLLFSFHFLAVVGDDVI